MQNDMRDRLVKLLDGFTDTRYCWTDDELADHLIANGVIVPPCKNGDTVYCIDYILKITEKCKVYGFQFVRGKLQLFVDNGECKFVSLNWYSTKDQAEQKLKELSENG